ncbi:hypothetical protein ACI6Q2_20160 [Chitinophagaceae bacterium LWZ2-11]
MTYPKIYSLSTVGIIQHYNHDYLFHHKRTDFVGPNGVGKSILADLLQLMFIYDKDKIKFGTEDVNDTRFIHSLPHETSCAYCFLNIIVEKDKFITIGIQIQNQERKRIIPFVIAREADLDMDKSKLALSKEALLFSRDFIRKGAIPDIQELADWLHDERKLKMTFFRNKDDVQEYYNFLYAQKLLPINLSKENNLKAFAKVIQSFSKAKTLKLSGKEASKNLKEFLFEETEEEIKNDFEKEKNTLEKVLKEYKRLNDTIKILNDKQSSLRALRQQEETYHASLKAYKIAELSNCRHELDAQRKLEAEGHQKIEQRKNDWENLQALIRKIPALEARMRKEFEIADNNYGQIHRYRQLKEQIEDLNNNITDLKMIVLPQIHDSWKSDCTKVDVTIRTVLEIKSDIRFAEPYLKRYTTLMNIEAARDEQIRQLDKLTSRLYSEKGQKEKLLQLLSNNKEDSLLSWYISNLPQWDADKLQAVLRFATLPTNEIPSPKGGMQFVDPAALGSLTTNKTKEGIWLKSGALSEFITHNPDANLLMDHTKLNQQVQQLIKNLQNDLAEVNTKLQALAFIRDGQEYDIALFDYPFDISISEAEKIRQLKTAVGYMLQRDEKTTSLQVEKTKHEIAFHELKDQLNIKYEEPEVVERDLKAKKQKWNKRNINLSNYSGQKTSELKALQKEIDDTKGDLERIIKNATNTRNEFNQLNTDYYKRFHENITEFNSTVKDLPTLKEMYKTANETYKANYGDTIALFEETKGKKNAAVNYERENNSYSFSVLERALLTDKIKTTDDIAAVLQDANNNRTQIAENIRDSMLKIFSRTAAAYGRYKSQVQTMNTFFVNRKISGKYNFSVSFDPNPNIKIQDLEKMADEIRAAATRGELQFDQSITDFLEAFFRKMARLKENVPIAQLLDPKTYFHLATKLEDEWKKDISGSTGESYSAIALLGVARLSTQKNNPVGLRFIILEELGSMDNTNFNIFPDIAAEFQYQIITMAPHTFNIGLSDEWYAHHLIKGKESDKINYYPSSSYFKTKDCSENLSAYLNKATA